ncbi:Hypothetical predicted protein, partial [Paramuricea clavata]
MADVVEKKIEGKLRLLKFNNEQTTKIVDSADLKAIERHVSVQGIKIESGDRIGEVRLWTETIELNW